MYNQNFLSPVLVRIFKTCIFLSGLLCFISLSAYAQFGTKKNNGQIALQESVVPVRPGIPGKTPFWNANAHQFIYAPAFDFKAVQNAIKYRYEIKCEDKSVHNFDSNVPYSPLSKVWIAMPTGFFELKVIALSTKSDSIGLAGSGKYYKAAYFNGPYHKPIMPYDKSATIALDNLMHKDYVNYWLTKKVPDPDYPIYRYPAKIFSALIVGAVTHARLKPNTIDAKRSTEIAGIVADYLISISFPKGSLWEYYPPTYYGYSSKIGRKPGGHVQLSTNFTIMGADAGNAYLDLYDLTGNEKYLLAAKRIAQTYLKNQLKNGSWYLYVNHETGKPLAENIAIPTSFINYFDRLRKDYNVSGLENATRKAFNWIMENPVKTFNWQGQFEDVKALPPYKRQSREQACDFAIYLLRNHKQTELAQELIRFAEDQFVIWEKPLPITIHDNPDPEKSPGWNSKNWITPSVQEQYGFFMPVSRAAGVMMEAYWHAYATTKKEIYLAKAQSIANALTLVQKEHHGDYPTMFTKYPMNFWLNSVVYPAKTMMRLQNNLEKLNKNLPIQP